jgi:excinuclease ABC subunit B
VDFRLVSDYAPRGDQPRAIDELAAGLEEGRAHQVLLGVTGSGKTFTLASAIARANRPALVIAHNKTLAAQLYQEFRRFFPDNAVEYFVSYYDYYQPEAYVPASDTYIEKDSDINEAIDRLRHSATRSLLTRHDVIVVASVSCIFGLGSPDYYRGMLVRFTVGDRCGRREIAEKLVGMRYERNDIDFHRGSFRMRGETVDLFPAYEERPLRIEMDDESIARICWLDPLTLKGGREEQEVSIFPASHYVVPEEQVKRAIEDIREELVRRITHFRREERLLEAQRIEERTNLDIEMIQTVGYCKGIENYSRHLTGRSPGEPPPTLVDYLPPHALIIIDESHQTVPQVRAMLHGDRSRKVNLVDFGFRLPSAFDNRPLSFAEFEAAGRQRIYVSATPGPYEMGLTGGEIVEQVIRPTGLLDPRVEVRPAASQVDDLVGEARAEVERGGRVMVTTLTKRMAEDLTDYLGELGIKVNYLHSDIDTLERVQVIRDLRLGVFDVLVGINLLREGLDLPEVTLVAVLDADREGFLRSETALIQVMGRAARNVEGRAILYADSVTPSMARAMRETTRRREIQEAYNREHGITPETVKRHLDEVLASVEEHDYLTVETGEDEVAPLDLPKTIARLEKEMMSAAAKLDFERAAELRDRVARLRDRELGLGGAIRESREKRSRREKAGRRGRTGAGRGEGDGGGRA